MEEISCFSTPGNPSLTHKYVLSDAVFEPPIKKNCSLTAGIVNATDNKDLTKKLTITQEKESVASSTIHVEEELSETRKESTN